MKNNIRNLYFCGDDKIGMGKYAQNLMDVILNCDEINRNNDNESYVIGIDAPWGTGKTYFVSMMKNYLEGKWCKKDIPDKDKASKNTGVKDPTNLKKTNTIYYDAWKNDFWDNAFEPFFDCVMQSECLAEFKKKEEFENFFLACRDVVSSLLGRWLERKLGKDTIIIIKEIKERANSIKKAFPEYNAFCNSIKILRTSLEEILEEKGKIVIIVDELDRCKPSFAVQTLEIVKHLFNVKGLVFIFSLDICQLSHSVKAVYGDGFDAIGYLERFFNYMTLLPTTHTDNIIQLYCDEFYIDLVSNAEEVMNAFRIISRRFNLSLRDMRTVFHNYNILQRGILLKYRTIPNAQILYFYFLTMKYKMPVLFYHAVNSMGEEFKNYLSSHKVPFIINGKQDKSIYGKSIYEYRYDEFVRSFDNIAMENLTFSIVNDSDGVGDTRIIYFRKNRIKLDRGAKWMTLHDKLSASMVLYKPDFRNYNKIKHYTVMEYIYRQLEMCDFIKSPESKIILHDLHITTIPPKIKSTQEVENQSNTNS